MKISRTQMATSMQWALLVVRNHIGKEPAQSIDTRNDGNTENDEDEDVR